MMTEPEWLACPDTIELLKYLRERGSSRKLRLFACACCRMIWDELETSSRFAVEVAERYADKQGSAGGGRVRRGGARGALACARAACARVLGAGSAVAARVTTRRLKRSAGRMRTPRRQEGRGQAARRHHPERRPP